MNVPVTFNITERCTAEQGDAAEDYEEPTDDCDREWPPVHLGHRLHGSGTDLLTCSGFSSVK